MRIPLPLHRSLLSLTSEKHALEQSSGILCKYSYSMFLFLCIARSMGLYHRTNVAVVKPQSQLLVSVAVQLQPSQPRPGAVILVPGLVEQR